jgi:hypothetical protein
MNKILIKVSAPLLYKFVMGFDPSYAQMNDPIVKKYGSYSGSYDRWTWHLVKSSPIADVLYLLNLFAGDDVEVS